eukprot:1596813-Pyramimonas_sp.AAC.1
MTRQHAAHGGGSLDLGGARRLHPFAARTALGRPEYFRPKSKPWNDNAANSFHASALSPPSRNC